MFRISIDLEERTFSGLEALGLRRRLRLRDASALTLRDATVAVCEVDEGFARAHFGPTDVTVSRVVSAAALVPDDVCDRDTLPDGERYRNTSQVVLRPDLPPARIRELWLAGRPA